MLILHVHALRGVIGKETREATAVGGGMVAPNCARSGGGRRCGRSEQLENIDSAYVQEKGEILMK